MKRRVFAALAGAALAGAAVLGGALTAGASIPSDPGSETVAVQTASQQSTPNHEHGQFKAIRAITAKYHNIARAEAAGYVRFTDVNGASCIDEPGMGAMGVHYVNAALIADPAIDASRPEALVYAPARNGTLELAAVEYIVAKADWDANHVAQPTMFGGRPFMVTQAPNRYGLPTFYSQHAWVWKANPAGSLAMWNPTVHCAWA